MSNQDEQAGGATPEAEIDQRIDDVVSMAKGSGTLLVISGVLGVLAGIFCVTAPMFAGWVTTLMIGLMMIVLGVLQIIAGIDMDKGTKGRGWTIFGGIVAILLGLFFVTKTFDGMAVLTWVISIFLIVEGVMRIVASLELKPVSGWGWMLFGGVVSIVLGFMLMSGWPYSALWFIGTVIGIHFLFAGFARIMLGVAVRRAAKQAG